MAGLYQRVKKSASSLYRDPFKWGCVKSVGLFLFGVYLARDLKAQSTYGTYIINKEDNDTGRRWFGA